MEVILFEKIDRLGGIGDLVNVKAGFARNYLLPQGKAKVATEENKAEIEARRAEFEKLAAEQLAALGSELQEPMKALIHTASETPKAAAEVIGKLREQVSGNMERDNQRLEERQTILQQLAKLGK